MALDDEMLWLRVRSGDSDAFGEFFERHAQQIFRFCFHRTASLQTSEDLMATVFLEAWRRRCDVPADASVAWLYGVALNVVRNQSRAIRRHAAALARVAEPRPEPDIAEQIVDRAELEREMRAVLEHLEGLSSLDQEVLSLCIWEEMPAADAARVLNIPAPTVRTRLHRARQHLARLLATDPTHLPEGREDA